MVASLISEVESGKIIRFLQDCDIPVYHYQCPKTPNSNNYCKLSTCRYCVLSLRGYITTTEEGRRDYAPLPAPPYCYKRWKCAEHGEEICERDCSVFTKQSAVYRIWKWDLKEKQFVQEIRDSWNPLENGFLSPADEKKEEEKLGAIRRSKRGNRGAPYSLENRRARESLRPTRIRTQGEGFITHLGTHQ